MISLTNVTKAFGAQVVLADVSLTIHRGERLGVVGPNGAGKTTIFALIAGTSTPDRGAVTVPDACRLGYVRQHVHGADTAMPLLDFILDSVPDLAAIETEIHEIETALSRGDHADDPDRLRRLGELQTRFEHLGGYDLKHRAEKALSGMGFAEDGFASPLDTFSGGWQSRAELIRVLLSDPDVLLLDEPSNYLDIPAIEWLQRQLRDFDGTLALISHDRYLLNSLTSETLEISRGRATRYAGAYDRYMAERDQRHGQQQAAAKAQQKKREQIERFVERFRYKNTKASQVQSRIKMLERMPAVEQTVQPLEVAGKIRLKPPPHCGAEVMRLEEVGFSYDEDRWVLRGVDLTIGRGDKVGLVGLNGTGKTTLLRILAGALEPGEGKQRIGHKVLPGYQSQDFADTMNADQTIFETVKAAAPGTSEQATRTLLGSFGFSGSAVEKRVEVLSGGEKIRAAFARLLINPPNLLLLDEPTTHLDIHAREALEEALSAYEGTVCFVSHDISFTRRVATSIVAMAPPGIQRYPGGYDYYRSKLAEEAPGQPAPKCPANQGGRAAGRRERAQARQKAYGRSKKLKKQVARAEKKIETMEAERAELVKAFETAASETDYESLNRRLKTIEMGIATHMRDWEEATTELDELTG